MKRRTGQKRKVITVNDTTCAQRECLKCSKRFKPKNRFLFICNVCKGLASWRNGEDEEFSWPL